MLFLELARNLLDLASEDFRWNMIWLSSGLTGSTRLTRARNGWLSIDVLNIVHRNYRRLCSKGRDTGVQGAFSRWPVQSVERVAADGNFSGTVFKTLFIPLRTLT